MKLVKYVQDRINTEKMVLSGSQFDMMEFVWEYPDGIGQEQLEQLCEAAGICGHGWILRQLELMGYVQMTKNETATIVVPAISRQEYQQRIGVPPVSDLLTKDVVICSLDLE